MKLLVERRADVSVKVNDGRTPLLGAALVGHLLVLKFLVEMGADVSVKNEDGFTPLHSAAINGYLSVVKLLVEVGADVRLIKNRWTASDSARIVGNKDVAEWLDSVKEK